MRDNWCKNFLKTLLNQAKLINNKGIYPIKWKEIGKIFLYLLCQEKERHLNLELMRILSNYKIRPFKYNNNMYKIT